MIKITRKRITYKKETVTNKNNNKTSEHGSFISVLLKRHRDSRGNHKHVILEDIDDSHVSVGTTTKPKKGKNSPNYKCENDIIGNGKQSYLRRQGIVDLKENYSDPSQGRMSEKDYAQAKVYGQRAKEKYLAEKKKK